MVCCSLRKVQAAAQRTADGLAILQMLADDQGSAIAGRLSEQQRDDLTKVTLQSWAAGQDGDRLARELLWKLLRSGAFFPHITVGRCCIEMSSAARNSRGVQALSKVLPVAVAASLLHSACHPVLQPAMAGSCQLPSQNAAQASGGR